VYARACVRVCVCLSLLQRGIVFADADALPDVLAAYLAANSSRARSDVAARGRALFQLRSQAAFVREGVRAVFTKRGCV
jgi:hypothetical protein